MKRRAQTVLMRAEGRRYREIADALGCGASTVAEDLARWTEWGEISLIDWRCDNGTPKVDEDLLQCVTEILLRTPGDFGWSRPTWTRELMARTVEQETGVPLSLRTIGRIFKRLGVRRGRPKPVVCCPWPRGKKTRRLNEIRRMIAGLKPNEVAVYEDEVDIHLNPKIGSDYMLPGQQRVVVTPGKNRKRYLAGALDVRTGQITWVESERKNTDLFIAMSDRLLEAYPHAKRIHVIADNYIIHKTKKLAKALAQRDGRIVIHYLPPYCPDENRIERKWKDLHDQVTRNHRCKGIHELMENVRSFMRKRERRVRLRLRRAG